MLIVIDVNGCVEIVSVMLVYNFNFILGGVGIFEICFGVNDGFVMVSLQGGVMFYIYVWSNGVSQQVVMNVVFGFYIVMVMDVVGCVVVIMINVFVVFVFDIIVVGSNFIICGVNNGLVMVIINQGVGLFGFNWSIGVNI